MENTLEEQKSHATVLSKEARAKEISPKDHLRIGIHAIVLGGGSGDLTYASKIAEAIGASEQASHYSVRVYTPASCEARMKMFASHLQDTEIITYSKEFNETQGVYTTPPMKDGKRLLPEENVMIFVCHQADKDWLQPETVSISISEFSSDVHETDLGKGKICIDTGFTFNPDKKRTIQAGIPFSRKYESILQRTRTERSAMVKESSKILTKKCGVPVDLEEQRIGLYYASSLTTNHLYFELLAEAQEEIDGNVTIVAPVGGRYPDNRDSKDFEKRIADLGFNYVADGEETDRGSKVTVVNPHRISNEAFLTLQVLSDLPTLVTGDQSLAEAVQKSLSETPSPFFMYCYIATKQPDFLAFIEKVDPYVSQLLASYFAHESPPEYAIKGSFLKNRWKPYLEKPLPTSEAAKLFYDEEAIQRFNQAMAKIPEQMTKERNAVVYEPETLVDVGKTTEKILEAVRMGELERVKSLLVR